MSLVNPSEQRHVIQESTHSDGSETILLRRDTKFSVVKRIVNRYNKAGYSATAYSDGRIEATPSPEKLEELKGVRSMERMK